DQRSVAPEKNIVMDLHGGPLRVAAPESMVAMTLGNLVRNAVQHGAGPDILCRAEGRALVVSNGGALPTGLAQSGNLPGTGQLENIPPRFTSHPGGHGMGLYLVRRICERYGWAIRLESAGGGVTATVSF